jgi:hypothetical protein
MLTTAQHDRGIRRPRPGDVLQDLEAHGQPTAIVVEIDKRDRLTLGDKGSALLEWRLGDGTIRVARRKISTMRKLRLVRENDPVDRSPAARHRRGQREARAGDVLADPRDEERLALVVEVLEGRVHLNWLETGRSSTRASSSLRWLRLVREG